MSQQRQTGTNIMSTFKSISDLSQEKVTNLFNQTGAFYAFCKKQFEEQKKPNVNYVSLASGLICPKEQVEELLSEFDKIHNQAIVEQVNLFEPKRIIENTYFNFETQITGDVNQVIEALSQHTELFPAHFTKEFIEKVCNDCFQKAIDNDWF